MSAAFIVQAIRQHIQT